MPAEDLPQFAFDVNGSTFTVSQPVVEGLQIRVLAQIPSSMTLVLERDHHPDRVIGDTDAVSLAEGAVHFYAKPPTSFG